LVCPDDELCLPNSRSWRGETLAQSSNCSADDWIPDVQKIHIGPSKGYFTLKRHQ
jgi:hypothetical protein